MNLFHNIITPLEPYYDILSLIALIILTFVLFTIITKLIKRYLLKKVRRKKQINNVIVFLDLIKYLFAFFLILIIFAAYSNRWGELGFIAGLLSVALGWALRRPITGVVAWLIIITRRPFRIRDRIIIMGMKGIITEITLTHIYMNEIGGTIQGEEESRRTIMIPTSIIFEQEVINYTHKDNYILDEVTVATTYESNLSKSEDIMKKSVHKIMKEYWEKFPKRIPQKPHIRLEFKASGIDVTVRYYSLANKRNRIATDIRREAYQHIQKATDVEFAYPHTEVLFREKKSKPKK